MPHPKQLTHHFVIPFCYQSFAPSSYPSAFSPLLQRLSSVPVPFSLDFTYVYLSSNLITQQSHSSLITLLEPNAYLSILSTIYFFPTTSRHKEVLSYQLFSDHISIHLTIPTFMIIIRQNVYSKYTSEIKHII